MTNIGQSPQALLIKARDEIRKEYDTAVARRDSLRDALTARRPKTHTGAHGPATPTPTDDRPTRLCMRCALGMHPHVPDRCSHCPCQFGEPGPSTEPGSTE